MNVCVFCGSGTGINPIYREAAIEFARLLSSHKCSLIYGGGNIGLMGIVADEMLRHSASVTGVIPDFLAKREVAHNNLSELIIVSSMHERKKRMADLTDVFIALPGGIGTLDELAEILTWKQLGLVQKPIGILNTNGYFDYLLLQLEKMVEEGFLRRENLNEIKVATNPAELITLLGVLAV